MPHIVQDDEVEVLEELPEPTIPRVILDSLPRQRESVREEFGIFADMGGSPVCEHLESILDPYLPAPTIDPQQEEKSE